MRCSARSVSAGRRIRFFGLWIDGQEAQAIATERRGEYAGDRGAVERRGEALMVGGVVQACGCCLGRDGARRCDGARERDNPFVRVKRTKPSLMESKARPAGWQVPDSGVMAPAK